MKRYCRSCCVVFCLVLLSLSVFIASSNAGEHQKFSNRNGGHGPWDGFSAGNLHLPGRSAWGGRIAYAVYAEDDNIIGGVAVHTELEEGIGFGVTYNYFYTDYFSVEMGADYIRSDVNDSYGSRSSRKAGVLEQIPIFIGGRFSLPLAGRIIPYAGAGMGYFFNIFLEDEQTPEVKVKNSIGWFAGGGADILLTRRLAFNVDVKYIWNDIEAGVSGGDETEFDMDMLIIGSGLKYYF